MDVRRRIPVKPQDVKNDPGQICVIETDQDDRVALDSDATQDVEIQDESKDDKLRKGANSDLSKTIPIKPQDVKNDPGQICEIETDQDDSAALDSDAAQDVEKDGESEDDKSRKGANSDLSKTIPSETVYKAMEDVTNKGKPK
ncbi:hypothetical protein QYM36_018852 [Artemia franciscana]|uniref:Uncharacterized protein n=1 Tax=Artemia franciscana TaxID=6661 RepID=A0AA88HBX9_ARTSF|nr:hypothetical protein QYM36_018852 [Artemia franciscana]